MPDNIRDTVQTIESAWTSPNHAGFNSTLNQTLQDAMKDMDADHRRSFMDAALAKLQADGYLGAMEAYSFGNEDSIETFGYSQGFGSNHKIGIGSQYYTMQDFQNLAEGQHSVQSRQTVDLATQFMAQGVVNNFSGIQGEDQRMFSSDNYIANDTINHTFYRDHSDGNITVADLQTWGGEGRIAGAVDDHGHSETAAQERWQTQNMLVQVSDNYANSDILAKIHNGTGVTLNELTTFSQDQTQMALLTADQRQAINDMVNKFPVIMANTDHPDGRLTAADVSNFATLNGTTLDESRKFVQAFDQYELMTGDTINSNASTADVATSPQDIAALDTALRLFGEHGSLHQFVENGSVSRTNWQQILAHPDQYGVFGNEAAQLSQINSTNWGKFDVNDKLSLSAMAQARYGSDVPDFNALQGADAFGANDATQLRDGLASVQANSASTLLGRLQTDGYITETNVNSLWQQKEANPNLFSIAETQVLNILHNSFDNLPGQAQGKVSLDSLTSVVPAADQSGQSFTNTDKDNVLSALSKAEVTQYLVPNTHTITDANLTALIAAARVSGNPLGLSNEQIQSLQELEQNHSAYGEPIDLANVATSAGYHDYDAVMGNSVLTPQLRAAVSGYMAADSAFVTSLLSSGTFDTPATATLNRARIDQLAAQVRNGTSTLQSQQQSIVTALHDSYSNLKGTSPELLLSTVMSAPTTDASGTPVPPPVLGGWASSYDTRTYRIGSPEAKSFGDLAALRAALVKSRDADPNNDATPITAAELQSAKVDILEISYQARLAHLTPRPSDTQIAANLAKLEAMRSGTGIGENIFGNKDLYNFLNGELSI